MHAEPFLRPCADLCTCAIQLFQEKFCVILYAHFPVTPTISSGDNVSVVEGETLELMVTIDFNLALTSITWTQDGATLVSGTDRVTIENSDLDPPNATSTLTRTDINRTFDDGVYVLTATNHAGSATATFTLDVLCKSTCIIY